MDENEVSKTAKIKALQDFLKNNEPVLDRNSGSEEYWELFAYRVFDYFEVNNLP